MAYKVEEVTGCTKKIKFEFEKLDLTTEIKNALVEKQRSSNLKGFRKGKAPISMIKQMFGAQIESEALNQFIQTKFYDVITEENLKIVGQPMFENMEYDSGKSIHFDAMIEVLPEIKINNMSSLSFEKEEIEVKDDELENIKNNYLNSKSELVVVDDANVAIDKGHVSVINFQGIMEDGSKPENMKGDDFVLEIGSQKFIPGFEEGMLGMKQGEKRTVNVTFPQEYQAKELQNAKVSFEVELIEIKEKKMPEFTDELAKEFGYESVENFNEKNLKTLNDQKNRESKEKLNQNILEKLVQENNFDIPLSLVQQQEEAIKKDMEQNLKQQGLDDKMLEDYFKKWKEDLTTKAEFQVRSGLILDVLSKDFDVTTSEEDFDKKLNETALSSGLEVDQIKKYYTSNEQMKKNLMYGIKEEKTFEKIYEIVNIK